MILIGISGRAEHGKTTVASEIVNHASKQKMFAKSYEISGYILDFCIDIGRIADKSRKQLTKDDLAILVETGEVTRETDPTRWIRHAMSDIEEQKPDVAVIPNVRLFQEAAWIRKAGGYIVKVASLNKNGSEFISPTRDPNNDLESESRVIQADYFLTTRRGEATLLRGYTKILFDHVRSLQPKTVDDRQAELDFDGAVAI